MANKIYYVNLCLLFVVICSFVYIASEMYKDNEVEYQKQLNISYDVGYSQGVNETLNIITYQLIKAASNCDTIPLELDNGQKLNFIAIECLQGDNDGS